MANEESMLTSDTLRDSLQNYILDELKPSIDFSVFPTELTQLKDNGKQILEGILDKSNYDLRMYEPAADLARNLRVFISFPNNYQYFQTDSDLYYARTFVYENLNAEFFISKHDVLIMIMQFALNAIASSENSMVAQRAIREEIYEELSELKVLEFVKYDEKNLNETEQEIKKSFNRFMTENEELVQLVKESCGPKDRKLSGRKTNKNVSNRFQNVIEKIRKKQVTHTEFETSFIRGMISTAANKALSKKKENGKVAVRLFEDGHTEFVLKSEFFNALCQLTGKTESKFKDNLNTFDTIKMRDIIDIYGKHITQIEFLRSKVLRAEHKAVPIHGHFTGEFGILAADAFFEVLRSWIIGKQIFQRKMPLTVEAFPRFFQKFFVDFNASSRNPYLIREHKLKELLNEYIPYGPHSPEIKHIRSVNSNGFTIQDLKEELIRLDIIFYPELTEYAERVLVDVFQRRRAKVLRTCDLFEAVFHCQINCFLNRLPTLKVFLHHQEACRRVMGYRCAYCMEHITFTQDIQTDMIKKKIKSIESQEKMKKMIEAVKAKQEVDAKIKQRKTVLS